MPHPPQSDLFERIAFTGRPKAHPKSFVVRGNARFTVLTARLLRLEWSATGQFEDRSSYAFPTRYAPPPDFALREEDDELIIDTGALTLRYREGSGPFTLENLSISFTLKGERQTWVPSLPDPQNLRGTRRTLDMCEGDAGLDEGLMSRAGWSLFDDSSSVLFEDGWVVPRPDHELQDWYFFGYGLDYKGALTEYTRFGGKIPLVPRFALGAWWSRYWAYSAQDLVDLVYDFEAFDVPLDVLVIDMDWHTPHSWTGYTWNRDLFPNPPAFLKWAHEKGLHVTLNLHPAEGVQPFEEVYPRFAEAMGVDPESKTSIPFRITDKRYVKNYFELLHHPMEEQGVDFWWMDWQQGESSEMKGLDPLPWLNHLHFQDSARRLVEPAAIALASGAEESRPGPRRDGHRRPMLYSRWGGLGNHRYPIGFSGDTVVIWPALQFQPYFTATASNVAYGWWSHDIGGHMGGATRPELYVRWVQFGALSPCLRLHATKDPRAERRPWKYSRAVFHAARAAFHWRYRLIPYIYTMARVAHDTGMSLCRPMYYEYPKAEAAYAARYQYFFGDQFVAAPIVFPADPANWMAATDVWVPPGQWVDYHTKETFTGPRWVRLVGDLERMPMLMKKGAILPLAAPFQDMPAPHLDSGTTGAIPNNYFTISVFPGTGRFRLYEDDGLSDAYQDGEFEWTQISTRQENEHTWVVEIEAATGHCPGLPAERQFEVRLEGSRRPQEVLLNGAALDSWRYDSETMATVILLPPQDRRESIALTTVATDPIVALGQEHNQAVVQADVQKLLGEAYPSEAQRPEELVSAILDLDAPGKNDALARMGGPFARFIEFTTPEEAAQQLGRLIVGAPANEENYDLEVDFVLYRSGRPETHRIQLQGMTTDPIIDTPFAFDGKMQSLYWESEARLTWRGRTQSFTHQSASLFPTIYHWHTLLYDHAIERITPAQAFADDTVDWQPAPTNPAHQANLSQPYLVWLRDRGDTLAGYLSTTIISPRSRDAVIIYWTEGPASLYLNGQEIPRGRVLRKDEHHPFAKFRFLGRAHRTAVVQLKAGRNRLMVATGRSKTGWRSWFFSAALADPEGKLLTDLVFD
jgi:alpha-glucosidase